MTISAKFPTAKLAAAIMIATLCLGCEKEGPAERAGKQLDEASGGIAEKLEDVGDELLKL